MKQYNIISFNSFDAQCLFPSSIWISSFILTGKFVSIKGTVVRVSNIKPFCTKMAFECNLCGDIQVRVMCIGVETGERQGHCPSQPIFKVDGYEYAPLTYAISDAFCSNANFASWIYCIINQNAMHSNDRCLFHKPHNTPEYILPLRIQTKETTCWCQKSKSCWYTEICTDSKRRNWALSTLLIPLLGHHIVCRTSDEEPKLG